MAKGYTNPHRFQGNTVLITGGTSGIGKAAALQFASEGALVAITGRRAQLGQIVKQEITALDAQALYIQADHTLPDDCKRAIREVIGAFGSIDILFNNAGVVVQGTAETTTDADWQLTMDLNVTAVWRMSRLALPHMRSQGRGVIINNASDWGLKGAQNAVAYCASKGAVIQMTKAMALDHAQEGIRINAVCPGDTFVERWIQQGYFKDTHPHPVAPEKIQSDARETIPMGRVGLPEEIARAVLFLASPDAAFITGTTLLVDGGASAG